VFCVRRSASYFNSAKNSKIRTEFMNSLKLNYVCFSLSLTHTHTHTHPTVITHPLILFPKSRNPQRNPCGKSHGCTFPPSASHIEICVCLERSHTHTHTLMMERLLGPVSERRLCENSEYVNPEMRETLGKLNLRKQSKSSPFLKER